MFDTAPNLKLLLRKERGANSFLVEALRYLLAALLWPRP